jgi:hypothetical protein
MTPQEHLKLEMAGHPIICTDGSDCSEKWSRAVQWVAQNAPYVIEIQTDSLIATHNSLDGSAYIGIVVTKASIGGGNSEINFQGNCRNMFGCSGDALRFKANFVETVEG